MAEDQSKSKAGSQDQGGERPQLPRAPQPARSSDDKPGPAWRVDPAPDGRGAPPEKKPMLPFSLRRFLVILAALLALNYIFVALVAPPEERKRIPYSPTFLGQIDKGNVEEISSKGDTVQGDFKKKFDGAEHFETEVPTFANTDELSAALTKQNVKVNAKPPQDRSLLETLIFSFGPTLLLVGLFIFFMRRASSQAGGGVLGQFGRSSARRTEGEHTRVTFADVAGIDEAKDELTEIVDFLKNPQKYQALGARIPRGVLLSGLPGTGKTLLAKAVAGEAGVPFFSISASEFIEAIVGVGASRVRDLFKQAKEHAPAIIFIDELDAIGRSRSAGGGFSGGHDEREQTLNQILTEMDGFETGTGVVVLGATNRPEVLDRALLRPGRFDRRVAVQPPDKVGRQKILEVHTRSVPLAAGVDLEGLAQATPGMVGADLANVVNEAALLAARRGHQKVVPRRLHRRDREDRPRYGAQGRADRRGPAPHRLPRGRPRDRRHAHPRRRPRAQGVDHPARPGARRDPVGARRRRVQLRGGLSARQDQGGSRRPGRRGSRLRDDHHRRRVRHPAGDRRSPAAWSAGGG